MGVTESVWVVYSYIVFQNCRQTAKYYRAISIPIQVDVYLVLQPFTSKSLQMTIDISFYLGKRERVYKKTKKTEKMKAISMGNR